MELQMCKDCPWAVSNHGRRQRGGYYSQANVRTLWRDLRRGGARMTCLRAESQSVPFTNTVHPSECAGGLALIIRELNSLADLKRTDTGRGNIREYLSRHPTGLSKATIYFWTNMLRQDPDAPTVSHDLVADLGACGLPPNLFTNQSASNPPPKES